jgi:hypothetical protein
MADSKKLPLARNQKEVDKNRYTQYIDYQYTYFFPVSRSSAIYILLR